MSISIAGYQKFRGEALNLKSKIGTMVNLMDGVVSSTQFTDALKEEKLTKLMDEYLS